MGGHIVERARSLLKVRDASACNPLSPESIFAVDSAFPKQPLDLVGVSLSIVAAAAVGKRRRGRGLERILRRVILVEYFSEVDQQLVVSTARSMERRIALNLVGSVDALLLDGEIFPYKRLRESPLGDPQALTRRLVEEAMARGVSVVGVVKRSYSSEMSRALGYELNDKALASLVLRRGEYVVLEPVHPLLAEYGCRIIYYKPFRGLPEAVKLEACLPKSLEACSLVSLLASESGATGLPWLIDLVDSTVKKAASSIEGLRSLILSRLARKPSSIVMGYPSNPQERSRQRR